MILRRTPLLVSLALGAGLAVSARAQVSELGAAADFSALETGSQDFSISKSSTIIGGDVGVDAGDFTFSGGGVITGQLDAGSGATLNISGGSTAEGGIVQPYSQMSAVVQDASNASTYYDNLTATQNLSSVGVQTITGGSGLNVIDVSGNLNVANGALVISGNSTSQFVFNVSGTANFQGGASITLEGISADQVVFNLLGNGSGQSGNELQTSGESDTAGVFLAENGAIDISGGTHDSEFITSQAMTLQSGVQIDGTGFSAVPELGPLPMALALLAAIGGLAFVALRRPGEAAAPGL